MRTLPTLVAAAASSPSLRPSRQKKRNRSRWATRRRLLAHGVDGKVARPRRPRREEGRRPRLVPKAFTGG